MKNKLLGFVTLLGSAAAIAGLFLPLISFLGFSSNVLDAIDAMGDSETALFCVLALALAAVALLANLIAFKCPKTALLGTIASVGSVVLGILSIIDSIDLIAIGGIVFIAGSAVAIIGSVVVAIKGKAD